MSKIISNTDPSLVKIKIECYIHHIALYMNKVKIDLMLKQERSLILENFLKSAPFDGWNEKCLANATIAAGLKKGYHLMLFPGGISEFTQYFHNSLNLEMSKTFSQNNSSNKISEKIIYLIELKLESYSKNKEAIRRLTSYNLLPQNLISAQQRLWQTCDQIWFLAGDTSTDYNYYTKRALLAIVYSSTLLYWLDDNSENYKSSKRFLRDKIKNIGNINKWKASASNFFQELFS